jgi:hypothetical protein
MIDENVGGNEQALFEEAVGTDNTASQNTSSDSTKVDPGTIRKSNTQGILNALSRASGQNLTSVEDAVAFIAKSTAQSQLGGNAQPVEQINHSNGLVLFLTMTCKNSFKNYSQSYLKKK